jgi:hypothetical protein
MDADPHAAHVIAAGGAAVNRPESNGLTHELTRVEKPSPSGEGGLRDVQEPLR